MLLDIKIYDISDHPPGSFIFGRNAVFKNSNTQECGIVRLVKYNDKKMNTDELKAREKLYKGGDYDPD